MANKLTYLYLTLIFYLYLLYEKLFGNRELSDLGGVWSGAQENQQIDLPFTRLHVPLSFYCFRQK